MNVWGYWKCPYCGEVVRADHKDCTKCGTSIPNDVKFFMDTSKPIEYVDKEQESDEENWLCSYCRCQNPAQAEVCESCGAQKSDALGTYHNRPEPIKTEPEPEPRPKQRRQREPEPKRKRSIFKLLLFPMIMLVILIYSWYIKPVEREGEVIGFSWQQEIGVEEFNTFRESGWNVPSGGTVVSSNREIRSYRNVLDHYEYKTKRVAKKVKDGYDVKYKDMGNGQFKEIKTPRYKTVYEEKKVKEPVYRQEPIYDTKYYYNIDKWKETNALRTSADDHEPKWAETDLPTNVESPKYGDKRQGSRRGTYWAIIKDDKGNEQRLEYSLDEWKDLKEGDKVKYKTNRNSDEPL